MENWIGAIVVLVLVVCFAITVFKGVYLCFEASTTFGLLCVAFAALTGIGSTLFIIFACAYWWTGANLPKSISRDLGL